MRLHLRTSLLSLLLLAVALLRAHAGPDTFGVGTGLDGAYTVPAINTVVNRYAALTTAANAGDAALVVNNAANFAAGDLVLVWQTAGLLPAPASGSSSPLDLTNSPVGRWELCRLSTVAGTTLNLTEPLVRSYQSAGAQVVRVPEYTTLTLAGGRTIVAQPWNGSTGGIVAFLVSGTMSNNGQVSVTGQGFRGGVIVDDPSGSTGATGLDEPGPVGAQKGEGVASSRYGSTHTGRGRVANAGGGGVAYGAGGGGGGNGCSGGQGGNTDLDADGNRPVGGEGGAALNYSALVTLLPGGGGGAGHAFDTGGIIGGNGGAGGGVVFVRAGSLTGAGSFIANGYPGSSASGLEAGGGGGAGGTIYLRVNGAAAGGVIRAQGGVGGNANTEVGPGGGGSGGRILFQKGSGTLTTTATSVIGVNPGQQPNPSAPGGAFYGATAGCNGSITTLTQGPFLVPTPTTATPANGSITSSLRPVMSGTISTPFPAGTQVVLVLDGADYATVTPSASGAFTFTPSSDLVSGVHTLTARGENSAQAISSVNSNTNTFTIDATAPAAPVVVTPANGSGTNDNTPTYSGTAEPGSTVTVIVDGIAVGTTTANASGNWSFTPSTPLAEGPHSVRATATDAAGNTSPNSNTNTFMVDTTPPAAPVVVMPANGSTTNDSTPTYAGTAEPGTTVSVVVDGLATGTTTANASGNWVFTPTTPLTEGPHAVNAITTDAAGNASPLSNTNTFMVDTTPPAAPVVVMPANGSLTNDNTPTYIGTAEPGTTLAAIVDGSPVGTTTADASGNWSFTQPSALAEGSHTVRATATDGVGNTSPNSNTNTFTVDATAPTVVLTSSTAASGSSTSTTPFAFTATFSESVTGFVAGDLNVTNGTVSGFSGSGTTYTFNVAPTTAGTATTVSVFVNSVQDAAGNGNSASNTYSLTLTSTSVTWNGSQSTDWYTAANWTPAQVPTATLNATIPGNTPFAPAINAGAANARNLTLNAGATLTMSGGTLAMAGNLTNNGTVNATGGTVGLGATTASSLLGSGQVRFWNLTVGSNGMQVATSAGMTVQRLLTLNGNLTTNGNAVVLESTPTLTAMVINNGSNVVIGNLTVQRYISTTTNPGLGYRHYSSPVSNAPVGSLATAGFTPVVNPAYNTSPAPASVTPFPNVYGYDQSRLSTATNSLDAFTKGWVSPSALSDALAVGKGYSVNISGGQTFAVTGPQNNGNVTQTLARGPQLGTPDQSGWQLLGNPYPAPLDWSAVSAADRPNLDAAIYVFASDGPYSGNYGSYNNGVGNISPVLALGQGFFTRVSTGQSAASLTFRNSQRVTSYTNPAYNRNTDTRPRVQLDLQGAGHADPLYVYFEQGATASIDAEFDAVKLPNTHGLNLSAVAGTQELAIQGLPALGSQQVTVPLQVRVPATGSYTLRAAELANLAGTRAYLRDRQTGALVDLSQQPSYSFTLNAAYTGVRFELFFSPQQVLAVAPASLSAQVAVFPNPASKAVFVELPASLGRQAATATLVDALGRTVRAYMLPAGLSTHALPLTEVASGVYSLRVATAQGTVTKKLVVE